jgi:predicted nucleic acid-binding protein
MVGRKNVDDLLRQLRERTIWVDRPVRITDLALKDEGDVRMVETAVTGGARCVVTTDREFLSRRGYAGVEFVTPDELPLAPGGRVGRRPVGPPSSKRA